MKFNEKHLEKLIVSASSLFKSVEKYRTFPVVRNSMFRFGIAKRSLCINVVPLTFRASVITIVQEFCYLLTLAVVVNVSYSSADLAYLVDHHIPQTAVKQAS